MAKERNRRKFDFSKSSENRFDFTKDEPDVVESPQQIGGENKPPRKSNTGKIVGGIAAAAAILAGVYFFGIKGDDDAVNDGGAPTEQTAQACETAQPETAQPAGTTEDATSGEEATVNNDSETPAPVETNETPASGDNSNAATPAKAGEKKAGESSTNKTPVAESTQPKQNNTATVVSVSAPLSGDVVENAKRVIRGDFGNGKERKDRLGDSYEEIQAKVNEIYHQKNS